MHHRRPATFGLVTKSNLILGMGETREEISQALQDLHDAGCELITITQYLRPSPRHHPVERWVKPEEFVELREEAEEIGFAGVMSGPLVRSSYRAGRLYQQAIEARRAGRSAGRDRPSLRHRTSHRKAARHGQEPQDEGPEQGRRGSGSSGETYQMTKKSDPRHRADPARRPPRRRPRRFALSLLLLQRPLGLVFPIVVRRPGRHRSPVLIVFGRRAQARGDQPDRGQAGRGRRLPSGCSSAAGRSSPRSRVTKQQDVVHRVVGPPGIVLIGEGNPNRLRPLMTTERRKHERVARRDPDPRGLVGHDAGQVPLRKLTAHVAKLGKELKPAEMTDVLQRIKALDANRSSIPMPKGPVPTSMKGMRGNAPGPPTGPRGHAAPRLLLDDRRSGSRRPW